jgi:hypothetical protein
VKKNRDFGFWNYTLQTMMGEKCVCKWVVFQKSETNLLVRRRLGDGEPVAVGWAVVGVAVAVVVVVGACHAASCRVPAMGAGLVGAPRMARIGERTVDGDRDRGSPGIESRTACSRDGVARLDSCRRVRAASRQHVVAYAGACDDPVVRALVA